LHGMTYYIFLKSLRSQEEFRKNPHVKIPPKSPSTNFQSIGKFKNPIFLFRNSFSLLSARPTLRPTRPLAQPARVLMACLRKYVFPVGSRLLSWPPPSHLSVKWARAVRSIFLPSPADRCHFLSSQQQEQSWLHR
jgi:hypothetical protein